MRFDRKQLLLYGVTDRSWLNGQTLYEQVRKALEGGVSFLQLREKNLSEQAFLEENPFEIVSLVCKEKYISIRYSYRNRSTMYKAIYRKETMVWEYKTPCNDVKEKDFLIDVLNRFDLVQSNMEYKGYIVLDSKIIISEKTAMCTGKSLDSVCKSLQDEVTNNYIIVEYNGYKKTNMWIYNNKDNKLDKMSIVY